MLAFVQQYFTRPLLEFRISDDALSALAACLGLFLITYLIFPETRWHRDLFYLFLVIPSLFLATRSRVLEVCREPAAILLGVFLIYSLLSTGWTADGPRTELSRIVRWTASFLIFSFTALLVLRNDLYRMQILYTFFVSAVLFSLFSIFWHYSDNSFLESRLHGLGRANNPNAIARASGLAAVGCYALACSKSTQPRYYIALLVSTVFLSTTVLLTGSRGAIIAIVVPFLLCAALTNNYRHIVIICTTAAIPIFLLLLTNSEMAQLNRSGTGYRLELWQQGITQFFASPYFGHGAHPGFIYEYGLSKKTDSVHNVFLAQLIWGGITGFALLVTILGYAFHKAWRAFRQHNTTIYLALLIFAILHCLFDHVSVYSRTADLIWLSFWFPVLTALSLNRNRSTKRINIP